MDLNHLNLRVRDPVACRAFYERFFGFRFAFEADGGPFMAGSPTRRRSTCGRTRTSPATTLSPASTRRSGPWPCTSASCATGSTRGCTRGGSFASNDSARIPAALDAVDAWLEAIAADTCPGTPAQKAPAAAGPRTATTTR